MYTFTYNDIIDPSGLRFQIQWHMITDECVSTHQHDFGELVILFAGAATHHTEDGDCPLAAGDVFYIQPHHSHGYSAIKGMGICNILFEPDPFLRSVPHLHRLRGFHTLFYLEPMLRKAQTMQNRLRLEPVALDRAEVWVRRILDECTSRTPGCEETIPALFTLLVAELARSCDLRETDTLRHLAGLARVASHIETHFADPIHLDDLVAMSNMSRASLERAFTRCYGVSPIAHVLTCRLAYAQTLLTGTDLSITEIAERSGFNDSNYFTRKFRECMGLAPRAYRHGIRV